MYKPKREAISKLHEHTGLGVQACYNALKEAEGDFDKAAKILFKKAGQLAHKRLGREMKAGKIFAAQNKNNNFIVLLCLASETDFVSRNDNFKQLGTSLAQIAADHAISDEETLLQSKYGDKTCNDAVLNLAGTTGENISITYYATIQAQVVGSYVHTGGRIAAILGLNAAKAGKANILQLAQDLAMHVVANDPIAIDEVNLDATILEEAKETMFNTLTEFQRNNPTIRKKALAGKMKKFLKENALMEQPFLHDESKDIRQLLAEISPELKITQFKRFQVYS